MRQLVYLPAAQRDFLNILEYIAKESASLTLGEAFVERVQQQCRKLAVLPGILGRARPELRSDIRSFAFKGYVIFFRYDGDTLEVVNVLEGHRDFIAHFQDDASQQ